jgi:ABC-type Na+ efflux pump permease subunit
VKIMLKLFILLKSEVMRLFHYKIIYFGLFVSLIWVFVLSFTSFQEAELLMPQLLSLDAGLMTIVLIGSSYYFEKQEGTLQALFVSPVSPRIVLIAKILASLVPSLVSITLISLTMGLIHGYWIPLLLALVYVILATIAHVSVGFILMFLSPDFMSLLVKYMGIALLFYLPSILIPLNLIAESLEWIGFFSPSYAAQYVIQSLLNDRDIATILLALFFLTALPSLVFPLYVYPRFKKEALRA